MKKLGGYMSMILLLLLISSGTKSPTYQFAVLKYKGGGDWYANPSSVPNLVRFCNMALNTNIKEEVKAVEVGSEDLFNYPFVHMTGHGNVVFSENDMNNLRKYLRSGGFLHVDDNYGMDEFVRPQLNKLFPNSKLVELPFSHPIFNQPNAFPKGLPKIHEHDNKAPQGFGLFLKGRLVLFYTVECDLGDGWEDAGVHNDSQKVREEALKMGANIVNIALTMGQTTK